MTAEEMFEKLGFYKCTTNEWRFIYAKQIKHNSQVMETYGIGFDLKNKSTFLYCTCDYWQTAIIKDFDIKMLKEIEKATEQLMKELGWDK